MAENMPTPNASAQTNASLTMAKHNGFQEPLQQRNHETQRGTGHKHSSHKAWVAPWLAENEGPDRNNIAKICAKHLEF